MTVLITGPTGTAGQYILEQMMTADRPGMTEERPVRVLALPETLHRVPFRNRIEIVPGALEYDEPLYEATRDVEVVFHAAHLAPPPFREPDEMRSVNAEGTRRLLEACAGSVRRFVLVGTAHVFAAPASQDVWPVRDNAARLAHGSPQLRAYGQSMIEAEDAVLGAHERYGMEYCILRATEVSGRNARFCERMVIDLLRNPSTAAATNAMWGTMQWLHGIDLGRAAMLAGDHPAAANQPFIVAGDEPITAYDILCELWAIINPTEDRNPYRAVAAANNPGRCKFDTTKIHESLGFSPTIPLRRFVEDVLGRIEFYTSVGIKLPGDAALSSA